MKDNPSAERLQGVRRHRFGLALGLAVAVALHVGLLLVPLPKGARQDAKLFQRGVVARAFRSPAPAPAPPTTRPGSPAPVAAPPPALPEPIRRSSDAGALPGAAGEAGRPAGPPELLRGASSRTATEGALAGSGPSQPAPAVPNEMATHASDGAGSGSRTETAGARPGPPARAAGKGVGTGTPGPGSGAAAGKGRTGTGPDEWSALLTDLANRGQLLKGHGGGEGGAGGSGGGRGRGAGGGAGAGRGRGGAGNGTGGGGGADDDEVVDPRIRITVVSYPPSALDESHPSVRYPDLRVHRRELAAGICRVYYRVWTDGTGRIVRTQIKTPETQEELRRYAPFVEAVKDAVADWPFPRVPAEVHVDVLFEIE